MNTQSIALLSILSRCNPEDDDLKKECSIQRIANSDAYKELAARKSFQRHFAESFSMNKLRSYSETELSAAAKAIPLIPTVLEDVAYSLRNGDAPSLTAKDRPDFLDAKSLQRLIEKLHNSTGKNYSNITPDTFMTIFDVQTVRSIGEQFGNLDLNCTDYDSALHQLFGDTPFCIRASELQSCEESFNLQVAECNKAIADQKKKKRRRRILKSEVGLIALLAPTLVGGLTGAISSGWIGTCTLLEVVLVILFWILG